MTLGRILVPSDFTQQSAEALRYALELARSLDAEIDLLHVVPAPSRVIAAVDAYLGRPLPHVREEVLAAARVRLARFLGTMNRRGVTVHARVTSGDPAAMICEHAVEGPDDLIVMGTHGWHLGSLACRLLGVAPCPVVTVRLPENRAQPQF